MVPSIYQAGQPFDEIDFCHIFWFRVVFSFSWDTLLNYSFFHLHLFDGVCFQYYQVYVVFLFSKHSDFSWFGSSTHQFSVVFSINLITSSDIWYILRQSIIQLCGIISYTFSLSIYAIATFFHLVLFSLRMCWSICSGSSVPLVPLQYPFYYSKNSPQPINE